LYLFYNSSFLNALNNKNIDTIAINYIDNIVILVTRFLLEKNITKFKQLYNCTLN